MRSSDTPATNSTASSQAEPLDRRGRRAALLAPADDDQLGVGALGAHLGQRLEQVAQALHGDVGAGRGDEPAGHAARRRAGAGTASGRRRPARRASGRVDAVVGEMSPGRVSDTVMTRGRRCATRVCIVVKRTSGAASSCAARGSSACSSSRRRSTVIGWWMVASTGRPVALDAEQAVAQALVVVHEVEVARAAPQVRAGPQAERQRLGERAGGERRDLDASRSSACSSQMPGIRIGKWSL